MKRVLIIEDHDATAVGIRSILENDTEHFNIEIAYDYESALTFLKEHTYDVVTLDLKLKDRFGLELLKEFRRVDAVTPVLVLSVEPEAHYALPVARAGGQGYLEKTASAGEIRRAVKQVMNGSRYISTSIIDQVMLRVEEKHGGQTVVPQWDDVNRSIIRLLCAGNTTKEIAREVELSQQAVFKRISKMREELNLKTNEQLAVWSVKMGLC
ncbi:response regulator [bacterium]|nr:response regulator [bacterium]